MEKERIYYQVYESLESPSLKKTKNLILIHGFMGSTIDWESLVNFLLEHSKNSLKIIAVLLPGHTQDIHNALKNHLSTQEFSLVENSVDSSNNSIKKLSKQILEIQEKENTLNCTYIGYSMGARFAMELASLNQKTESLILESSFTHWKNKEEQKKKKDTDFYLLNNLLSNIPNNLSNQSSSQNGSQDGSQNGSQSSSQENLLKENFKQFLLDWYNLDLFKGLFQSKGFASLLEKRLQQNVKQLHEALQAYSSSTVDSYLDILKNLNHPIFYIYGEDDIKYKNIGLNLKKIISTVNLHKVKNASHNIHFQQAVSFNNLILDILNSSL